MSSKQIRQTHGEEVHWWVLNTVARMKYPAGEVAEQPRAVSHCAAHVAEFSGHGWRENPDFQLEPAWLFFSPHPAAYGALHCQGRRSAAPQSPVHRTSV